MVRKTRALSAWVKGAGCYAVKEDLVSHMHMVSFSTNISYLGGKLVHTANSAAVQLKPPRGLGLVLAAVAQFYVR